MSYTSLHDYILYLERKGELVRVKERISPEYEMTEITDRLSKIGGKAILFTNNGTQFPVLMNTFGSTSRTLSALGLESYEEYERRLNGLFALITSLPEGISGKLKMMGQVRELFYAMPKHSKGIGKCFEVQMHEPDLNKIPILKCWPYDGGKFITLPMVHTVDPETHQTNIGMYRMQVFNSGSTGMHWHRHKGGAAHFRKYKKLGKRMPVVVTLGGDPVYTYCATAPLPEMITEYAFAGFLRKKKVKLVKCMTSDIEVPEDVDFVIEGYINPDEDLVTEGPFGDHTGFYSLPDAYPVFHITHISHRKDAVYPATVVGIPPMEDAYLGEATEQLFLPLIRKLIIPEIVDMYMPVEGGFHNLAIVSIRKEYPGQAVKVMNAMWGAGQMMFVRNIIVVGEDIDVRNPDEVIRSVLQNTIFPRDFHFMYGPLDVLDHANSVAIYGKKMGIDATHIKTMSVSDLTVKVDHVESCTTEIHFQEYGNPLMFVFIDKNIVPSVRDLHLQLVDNASLKIQYVIYLDNQCQILNMKDRLWMFLANFDPEKDLYIAQSDGLYVAGFDGTMKTVASDGIIKPRPNVIVMDEKTMNRIDQLWCKIFPDQFVESPSRLYKKITLNEGYLHEK